MYLLIFIYHFNFSGSHCCYKLMGLRGVMPYSLVRAFRHFAKLFIRLQSRLKKG